MGFRSIDGRLIKCGGSQLFSCESLPSSGRYPSRPRARHHPCARVRSSIGPCGAPWPLLASSNETLATSTDISGDRDAKATSFRGCVTSFTASLIPYERGDKGPVALADGIWVAARDAETARSPRRSLCSAVDRQQPPGKRVSPHRADTPTRRYVGGAWKAMGYC